jgi:hypothetical protein
MHFAVGLDIFFAYKMPSNKKIGEYGGIRHKKTAIPKEITVVILFILR